jgi:hypothetical protein
MSIGLLAYASARWRIMVFARHLDSFIVTPNARPPIRTLQKHMPTLTRTATQLNRRAIMGNNADYLTVNLDNFVIHERLYTFRQFSYQRN